LKIKLLGGLQWNGRQTNVIISARRPSQQAEEGKLRIRKTESSLSVTIILVAEPSALFDEDLVLRSHLLTACNILEIWVGSWLTMFQMTVCIIRSKNGLS
jgi:hypothetical protein